jgi:signal peptidase I
MTATLLEGDYVFVTKYAYGYSRYSFPFGLIDMDGRIFGSQPQRGDVIVFKLPADNETDYIKRVIGLPGDEIQMIDGVLHLNGVAVEREMIEPFVDPATGRTVARYRETLPGGVSYEILDLFPRGANDDTELFVVGDGEYFVMGDNRDNSADSRLEPNYADPIRGGVGMVPFENIIGRAEFILFSIGDGASPWEIWRWPTAVRWDRLFDGL